MITEDFFKLQQLKNAINHQVDSGFSLFVDRLRSGINYNPEALNELLALKDSKETQLSRSTLIALKNIGNSLMKESRIAEATIVYYCLTLLSPRDADVWLMLGNSYYHTQKFDDAIVAYLTATMLNSSDYRGHLWIAHSFEALQQRNNAIVALDKAIKMLGSTPHMSLLIEAENFKSRLEKSRR